MRPFAACLLACAMAYILPARAQTLGPRLQDATIVGQGSTITIRRLPVRTPEGIVYRDITIDLQVDASGDLHVDASGSKPPQVQASLQARQAAPLVTHDVTVGSIVETATPPEVAASFTPGMYRSDAGGLVNVVREGNRLFENFPNYALSALNGDNVINSAEWNAGPIRVNPHHRWLNDIGITSDAYSYGVVQSSGAGHFDAGMLIGAVQNGPTLTIVSFHRRGCCTYSQTPTSQVTYTRIGG